MIKNTTNRAAAIIRPPRVAAAIKNPPAKKAAPKNRPNLTKTKIRRVAAANLAAQKAAPEIRIGTKAVAAAAPNGHLTATKTRIRKMVQPPKNGNASQAPNFLEPQVLSHRVKNHRKTKRNRRLQLTPMAGEFRRCPNPPPKRFPKSRRKLIKTVGGRNVPKRRIPGGIRKMLAGTINRRGLSSPRPQIRDHAP